MFNSGIANTLVALYLKEKLASYGGEVVLRMKNGTGSGR